MKLLSDKGLYVLFETVNVGVLTDEIADGLNKNAFL